MELRQDWCLVTEVPFTSSLPSSQPRGHLENFQRLSLAEWFSGKLGEEHRAEGYFCSLRNSNGTREAACCHAQRSQAHPGALCILRFCSHHRPTKGYG